MKKWEEMAKDQLYPYRNEVYIMTLNAATLLLIGLVYFGITRSAYAQTTHDFRQVSWGDPTKQVKESEREKPSSVRREKLIYTNIPLADRKVGLEYSFNGDSLLSATYYYYVNASISKEDVVAAATSFEAQLKEKYGPGKVTTLDDTRNVKWLTPRTQINLSLGNVDRGWSVEIEYLCRVCYLGQGRNEAGKNYKPLKDIKDF